MMVKVTLEAMITLPEGTTIIGDRTLILPNRDWVKPWIVLELNDSDDLNFTQLEEMGIDITEGSCTIDVIGGAT